MRNHQYAFISYSTKNQTEADALRKLLNDEGIETWMAPGDIPAGSKYARVINCAIKECACFVLMLSNEAQNSIWVSKETERAVNYKKPVFPVQIENVTLNDEFELYISTDQIVSFKKNDKNVKELKKLISGIIVHTGRNTTISSKEEKTTNAFTNQSGVQFEEEGLVSQNGKNECIGSGEYHAAEAVVLSEQSMQLETEQPEAENEDDAEEEMDIDEFAQYACRYAAAIDCSITGKNMLALYKCVEILEEKGIPLTRKNAEELIKEAAYRAEKPSFGRMIRGLLLSKYDKDGLLILKEEHFSLQRAQLRKMRNRPLYERLSRDDEL